MSVSSSEPGGDGWLRLRGVVELVIEQVLGDGRVSVCDGMRQVEHHGQVQRVWPDGQGLVRIRSPRSELVASLAPAGTWPRSAARTTDGEAGCPDAAGRVSRGRPRCGSAATNDAVAAGRGHGVETGYRRNGRCRGRKEAVRAVSRRAGGSSWCGP